VKAILLLFGALVVLAGGCSTISYTRGIPNLHQVEADLWRGGQPNDEGWAYLKSLGVKTVVKLNFEKEGSDEEAKVLGMNVYSVEFPPSDLENLEQGPTQGQLDAAVALLIDPKLRPLYVHCQHGQDRTGLVVGAYRVAHDYWTRSKAYREMKNLGFHWELLGLLDAWEDF